MGLAVGQLPNRRRRPEAPETVEELTPLPQEVVIRAHILDKFYGTSLDLLLRARDIRYLMVTGPRA